MKRRELDDETNLYHQTQHQKNIHEFLMEGKRVNSMTSIQKRFFKLRGILLPNLVPPGISSTSN